MMRDHGPGSVVHLDLTSLSWFACVTDIDAVLIVKSVVVTKLLLAWAVTIIESLALHFCGSHMYTCSKYIHTNKIHRLMSGFYMSCDQHQDRSN